MAVRRRPDPRRPIPLAAIVVCLWAACGDGSPSPGAGTQLDASAPAPDASAPAQDASAAEPDAAIAPRPVALIDHSGWERYEAALDPLASHQPAEIQCAQTATRFELASFEVDTTRCNYVLEQHPSLLSIAGGATIQLTLLYYDLIAPEPAEAHLAILFGDAVQWEARIPIPSPGAVLETRFLATRALLAGDPIRLHLHNHGSNSWRLISLDVLQP